VSFQRDELARLRSHADRWWELDSHVLPYEIATETLQADVRQSALDYFKDHNITWWTSPYDMRTKDMEARPTGHLNSSQVACVNHLEPARVDAAAAARLVRNINPFFAAARVDDGYVDYEWIGSASYLEEPGVRTRGANVTSLDALMCGEHDGQRTLLAIEWKYLESYGVESVATSKHGTDRVKTYRRLLEHSECPISVGNVRWLFYEPYYQLMRQTLLAWQMVEHHEFGASDWLHIHVVPALNVAIRHSRAAPDLLGETMADKWRSVLKQPERYVLTTATELLDGVGCKGRWAEWREWMRQRYLT